MAAFMAWRRCGSTARRRSWPWKLDLRLGQDYTNYGKAISITIAANNERRRCGHGDGARRPNTGGAAALPSAASEK